MSQSHIPYFLVRSFREGPFPNVIIPLTSWSCQYSFLPEKHNSRMPTAINLQRFRSIRSQRIITPLTRASCKPHCHPSYRVSSGSTFSTSSSQLATNTSEPIISYAEYFDLKQKVEKLHATEEWRKEFKDVAIFAALVITFSGFGAVRHPPSFQWLRILTLSLANLYILFETKNGQPGSSNSKWEWVALIGIARLRLQTIV